METIPIVDRIREVNHGDDSSGSLVIEGGQLHYYPAGVIPPVGKGTIVTKQSDEGYAAEAACPSIPSEEELYVQGGIFERSLLRFRRVMVIGVGSVGSAVSEALIREGLGMISIFEMDRVELHNLSRYYVAGLSDVDRLKTEVMKDFIHARNPYAKVDTFPIDICANREILKEEMQKADLVICATDNNASRFVVASTAAEVGKTVIYSRAETRAEGLNVFVQRPGAACYNCLVGNGGKVREEITNEKSARANGTIPSYTSPEDAGVMVQIGLPSDISPLVNMTVKLALVELTSGLRDTGIESLAEELSTYNYFLWVNRRDMKYAQFPAFNYPGDGPRILRWYGCVIPVKEDCCLCR